MKKLLIAAIAFMPFVMAHAANTPTPNAEKASASEIITPQAENVKADTVAEKPEAAKASTPKKQKMGKAGGKGG